MKPPGKPPVEPPGKPSESSPGPGPRSRGRRPAGGLELRVLLAVLAVLAVALRARAVHARAGSPRAALLAAAGPHNLRPRRAPAPLPAIPVEHLTTHATYALRPDLPGGRFSPRQMKRLSALLRCHHTGKQHAMSARLIEIVYATARHFRNAKMFIIAGYRAPAIAAQKGNPKSPHKRGVACDFRLAGVSIEALRDYVRETFHNVGVGYYPNAEFVHVDVGRTRDAFWIDYSSPGQRARYSPNAADAKAEPAGALAVAEPAETAAEPGAEIASERGGPALRADAEAAEPVAAPTPIHKTSVRAPAPRRAAGHAAAGRAVAGHAAAGHATAGHAVAGSHKQTRGGGRR